MILTYRIRHNRNFSIELRKARQVAEFAIKHRTLTTKDVRHIGLKSLISNQILRKYSGNRNAKKVSKVKLTLPAMGIRFSHEDRTITIPSLKLELEYQFRNDF
jgi:putative transposase